MWPAFLLRPAAKEKKAFSVMRPLSAIFGCSGLRLTPDERRFFKQCNPLGFILFARNVDTPVQVRALVQELRDSVGRADAPVLIDQEGGRVQRLRAPHWREAPPARRFGDLFRTDRQKGARAVWLNYRLIAAELVDLGIDVDCVPCIDVPVSGAHDVIADRAFAMDPDTVSKCARIAAKAMQDGGVLTIAKHVPGHGRAGVDSHMALPHVVAPLDLLAETDFSPFRDLADLPMAMTAHIIFDALDPGLPVTHSSDAIAYLRAVLGVKGLLMTDDLSMKALGGSFAQRTAMSLSAGCDIVLHCNGEMAEMTEIADAASPMRDEAWQRWTRAASFKSPPQPFDETQALRELSGLLG